MITLHGPRAVPVLAWMAVALPWLWPWAPPPSPSVPGLLVTWCLTALLWGVLFGAGAGATPRLPSSIVWGLTGLLAWAAWRMPVLDLALLGGLAGSVLCVVVASYCVTTARAPLLPTLCKALVGAAVISTLIAGLQYSGLLHQPLPWLSWLHASPNEEAYGQLRQRNQFGSLMSLGLAAWLYLAQSAVERRTTRVIAWVILLVLTLGQVASTSRTGALTWIGVCLLGAWWPTRTATRTTSLDARAGAGMALIGFMVMCWIVPALATSLATVELPKVSAFERLVAQTEGLGLCESRVVLWRHVLELAQQQPWIGWGWGELDYAHATRPVEGVRFCGQLGNAHNLLLQTVVEWGWPLALCGWGALVLWILRSKPWQVRTPSAMLGWSWLGVICVHSLLEFPLWYGPFQLVLGLAIGLINASRSIDNSAKPSPHQAFTPASTSSAISRGVVSLWLGCTLWAGWDYHRVSQIFQPAAQRSTECRIQPQSCLDDVVWFHQGRDFALLGLNANTMPPQQASALAQRVAHFAPEPWVLAWAFPKLAPPSDVPATATAPGSTASPR